MNNGFTRTFLFASMGLCFFGYGFYYESLHWGIELLLVTIASVIYSFLIEMEINK